LVRLTEHTDDRPLQAIGVERSAVIGDRASLRCRCDRVSWIFADDYLKHLDCVLHCAGHWPRYVGACVEGEHTRATFKSHRRADADERLMGRRSANRIAGITAEPNQSEA